MCGSGCYQQLLLPRENSRKWQVRCNMECGAPNDEQQLFFEAAAVFHAAVVQGRA